MVVYNQWLWMRSGLVILKPTFVVHYETLLYSLARLVSSTWEYQSVVVDAGKTYGRVVLAVVSSWYIAVYRYFDPQMWGI